MVDRGRIGRALDMAEIGCKQYWRMVRRGFGWMLGIALGIGVPVYFLGERNFGITVASMVLGVLVWSWMQWMRGKG